MIPGLNSPTVQSYGEKARSRSIVLVLVTERIKLTGKKIGQPFIRMLPDRFGKLIA
jgi:hypothetical protein